MKQVNGLLLAFLCLLLGATSAFQSIGPASPIVGSKLSPRWVASQSATELNQSASSEDPNELIAKRIIVKGDVQGGYYRSCVLNEVSGRLQ